MMISRKKFLASLLAFGAVPIFSNVPLSKIGGNGIPVGFPKDISPKVSGCDNFILDKSKLKIAEIMVRVGNKPSILTYIPEVEYDDGEELIPITKPFDYMIGLAKDSDIYWEGHSNGPIGFSTIPSFIPVVDEDNWVVSPYDKDKAEKEITLGCIEGEFNNDLFNLLVNRASEFSFDAGGPGYIQLNRSGDYILEVAVIFSNRKEIGEPVGAIITMVCDTLRIDNSMREIIATSDKKDSMSVYTF